MADSITVGDLLGTHTDVDFDDPLPLVNETPFFRGLIITFMLISWFCVCFRLYARLVIIRMAGWDDLLIGLCLLTTTMFSVATAISPNFGLGQHILTITLDQLTDFLHIFYFTNAAYLSATALIKLSLLFQYLRLFDAGSKSRKICIALIYITSIWGLAFSFIGWFPCFPVSAYWENPLGNQCYGYGVGFVNVDAFTAAYYSHSATNSVLDLLVLFLPLPLLFKKKIGQRKIDRKTWWGLCAIFTMGAIVNMFSIWRLVCTVRNKAAMWPAKDPTWYAPIVIVLAALEVDMANICASVPVFWPVFEAHFGKIFVTKEVRITTEERWTSEFPDDQSLSELSPQDELKSRSPSDVEVGRFELAHVSKKSKDGYFETFDVGQLDAFQKRLGSKPRVEANPQPEVSTSPPTW